ncbi:MAG: T9SS type A sorting domain-containing protein [Ignavibacteriaceae bacterium]|nr:T9SS type A sorting domain-containing protein [Ignavibacteriaceae bacterium]
MKKILLIAFLFLLPFSLLAQRAVIKVEGVSRAKLTSYGLATNSVSAGLKIVPNLTYSYLSPLNIANSDPILTATWQFVSRPSGSAAAFEAFPNKPTWTMFKPDVKGEYQVKLTVTTAAGSDDTTMSLFAGSYVGVGNYEGVAAAFPQCMSCHGSMPAFTAIFDKWKVSGHATRFKNDITSGSTHFSTSCMKCHTTGYDHNLVANNNGFDDVAAQLGWVWYAPPDPSKWDSLKTNKPGLVNHANIGCEMCHGTGSEHGAGGNVARIQVTLDDATCGQCHDAPWRYNEGAQYENSMHSVAIWSSGFATRGLPSGDLQQCMRCHSGKGYVMYTNGETQTTPLTPTVADHVVVTCATCHDPHGNQFYASLRQSPVAGDTLANGYNYTNMGGTGQTCMSCHKARQNNVTYVNNNLNANWGPHYSGQADILFGQNAAPVFDANPYLSSGHKYAIADGCVDCHMYATTDTGTVNRDKVGGHSMKLRNAENDYQHTKACESCHGPKTSFADFVAAADYDRDGNIEPIQDEVKGLERLLRIALPPIGLDSINWAMIVGIGADSMNYRKAYFNYRLVHYDGSYGMHNTKFTIDVLSKSIKAINNGFIPVELMAFNARTSDNTVVLNWETGSETNNKGFSVERKINGNWKEIGFVNGKGTTTGVSKYTYTDNLVNVQLNGTVSYRLKQVDFDGTSEFSKVVNVNINSMPVDFSLAQNYPNPFNPSTSIKFTVPVNSNVKIAVYNAMGKLVKELVNRDYDAGTYSVEWLGNDNNGAKVASGIYFYKMDAGNKSITKKMVLMK